MVFDFAQVLCHYMSRIIASVWSTHFQPYISAFSSDIQAQTEGQKQSVFMLTVFQAGFQCHFCTKSTLPIIKHEQNLSLHTCSKEEDVDITSYYQLLSLLVTINSITISKHQVIKRQPERTLHRYCGYEEMLW